MRTIIACMLLALVATTAPAQIKHIKPSEIYKMPNEYKKDGKKKSIEDLVDESSIYQDLYSGFCSWYCGGVIDTVMASSNLDPIKEFDYIGANAHDFDHTSVWAEGAQGQGIGEYLEYHFPGSCPRITTVKILNGHVKSEKAWRENSRVKQLKMYYNGEPYAILELQDSRTCQLFDVGVLGFNDSEAPEWTLKFEIMDVYPGTKYEDTVISELYFDGIDVH